MVCWCLFLLSVVGGGLYLIVIDAFVDVSIVVLV